MAAGLAVLGVAAPADAIGPAAGRDFSEHVRECNDHFDGQHNPGVHHRGYSGWEDHMATCM